MASVMAGEFTRKNSLIFVALGLTEVLNWRRAKIDVDPVFSVQTLGHGCTVHSRELATGHRSDLVATASPAGCHTTWPVVGPTCQSADPRPGSGPEWASPAGGPPLAGFSSWNGTTSSGPSLLTTLKTVHCLASVGAWAFRKSCEKRYICIKRSIEKISKNTLLQQWRVVAVGSAIRRRSPSAGPWWC
jgi:hypothetical protein